MPGGLHEGDARVSLPGRGPDDRSMT